MATGVDTGYSGQSAIAMVRGNTDEMSQPADSQILAFLNVGVKEVQRLLSGIRDMRPYPTVQGQTLVSLDNDIQEPIGWNFSSGSTGGAANPWDQGTLVYPIMSLDQAMFMDAAAGFPAVGFGPPQAVTIVSDKGYAPTNTLPAPAAPGLTAVAGSSDGNAESVVITYVNANGETTPSPASALTPLTNQSVQVASPPGYQNATGYNVYKSENGSPYFLNNATPVALGTPWTIVSYALWDVSLWDVGIWGFTNSTQQPPTVNSATGAGQGGSITLQLYPAAMPGQLNVYARIKPQLWTDTTANSWTNLDSTAQEAVILFATMRTLYNRSRGDEASELWQPQFDTMIADMKESYARRTRPKSGQVRDVRNRSFPSAPWWMAAP